MNESALLLSAFENRLIVGLKRVTAGLNVRCQFVLFTNRKSHTVFRLVPKLMTLNDLEQRDGHWQVTNVEMTQDQTWRSIRMHILVRPYKFKEIFLRVIWTDQWNFRRRVKFTGWSFASAFTELLGEVTASATRKMRMCVCGCRTSRVLMLIMTLPLNMTLP